MGWIELGRRDTQVAGRRRVNAAESLVQTAIAARADVCLANPGTTELELLAALDSVPGIRGVLGLSKGCAREQRTATAAYGADRL